MRSLLILLFISLSVYSQKTESDLSLLPWPQKLALTEGVFILQKNFTVSVTGNPHPRILDNVNRFLRRLDGRTGLFLAQGLVSKVGDLKGAQLEIHCEQKGSIGIAENESYQLAIHSDKIRIDANSDIGALHGLETLLQLLDNESSSFYFPNVVITDYPRFKWRGLMIDAARHFQPVGVIKRNLDAMASMKMNVFHWHLADDQGWRIQLKKHPELVERASDGLFYTQEEIVAIVKYAEDRGIMVVPEIDVPGHASALLTAYPEIGSVLNYDATTYQIERNAGVFRPTLDPSNPKTYKVLASIFDEVAPLFRSPYFHIGGDENEGKDWDENPRIQAFKKKQGLANNHELQTYFTLQLVPMLKKHGKKLMGWEEIMDDTLPKEVVIHSWKGENEGVSPGSSLAKAAKAGYTTILSNGYYLDLMLGLATHYQVDPMEGNTDLTAAEQSRIIGGEAVMWSELVSSQTIDSRIWPRAAAVAERLWSDKSLRDISSLRKRLEVITFRLEELGIDPKGIRGQLLRNIANNQDPSALDEFSNLCEPLKGYSRNKGGTEYQMYSPLTLFADACTADASAALAFDTAVENYLANSNPATKNKLIEFFEKWILIDKQLLELSTDALLIQPILPLSKSLSAVSIQFLRVLDDKQAPDLILMQALLVKCNSKEQADVELAVSASLKRLLDSLK